MTSEDSERVKPIGAGEARERAEDAVLSGDWDEAIAWSLLGLLITQGKRR